MTMQALMATAVLVLAGVGQAAEKAEPKLTYKQDGADLLVTTEVTANASPHAQLVFSDGPDDALTLKYLLVQNTTALVRSQKKVTITWKLVGKTERDVKVVKVDGSMVNAKTGELQVFAEQMQKVVEAGEKRGV